VSRRSPRQACMTGRARLTPLTGTWPLRNTEEAAQLRASRLRSRKPGKILPLTGVRIDALTLAEPVDGTAVVLSDGTVNIGVWAHSMSPISANDVLWVLKGADADFNGTGRFDNNGDYSSDGPVTWTSADCATITIP